MHALCRLSDLCPGEGRRVELPGRPPLAVFAIDGQVHVTDDTCTHEDASLCDGELKGHEVLCPYHFGSYDVRTGAAMAAPCVIPLRVYLARIEDGQVLADLDQPLPPAET